MTEVSTTHVVDDVTQRNAPNLDQPGTYIPNHLCLSAPPPPYTRERPTKATSDHFSSLNIEDTPTAWELHLVEDLDHCPREGLRSEGNCRAEYAI